jgi:hypothetical protein
MRKECRIHLWRKVVVWDDAVVTSTMRIYIRSSRKRSIPSIRGPCEIVTVNAGRCLLCRAHLSKRCAYTVAEVLDEPFSQLTPLSAVAVQVRRSILAGTVSILCSLAGQYGHSAELAQLSKLRQKLRLQYVSFPPFTLQIPRSLHMLDTRPCSAQPGYALSESCLHSTFPSHPFHSRSRDHYTC